MNVLLYGLGRTGLPQALALFKAGHNVIGVDRDSAVVAEINDGRAPFFEPDLDVLLRDGIDQKQFVAIMPDELDPTRVGIDAIVISIGFPVDGSPEGFIRSVVTEELVGTIKAVQGDPPLILIRSTVPVGTTRAFVEHIELKTQLRESEDFFVAHMPERIAEGVAVSEEWSLPKLVGVASDAGFDLAVSLFSPFEADVIRLPSSDYTELGKLMENSWRDLTFAFSNDMALLAEELSLDINLILGSINHQYPRNRIPYPGPVSGYCLSKDPLILDGLRKNREVEFDDMNTLSGLGRSVHATTINHIVQRVVDAVSSVDAPEIAILGLSFKPDVDDYRESHAIDTANSLADLRPDAVLHLVDPYINTNRYTELPASLIQTPHRSYSSFKDLDFSHLSAVVICTPHKNHSGEFGGDVFPAELVESLETAGDIRMVYDAFGAYAHTKLAESGIYRRFGGHSSMNGASGNGGFGT